MRERCKQTSERTSKWPSTVCVYSLVIFTHFRLAPSMPRAPNAETSSASAAEAPGEAPREAPVEAPREAPGEAPREAPREASTQMTRLDK